MSATVPWIVKVLVATEDYVEVSGITEEDARKAALSIPGVLQVLEVIYK